MAFFPEWMIQDYNAVKHECYTLSGFQGKIISGHYSTRSQTSLFLP